MSNSVDGVVESLILQLDFEIPPNNSRLSQIQSYYYRVAFELLNSTPNRINDNLFRNFDTLHPEVQYEFIDKIIQLQVERYEISRKFTQLKLLKAGATPFELPIKVDGYKVVKMIQGPLSDPALAGNMGYEWSDINKLVIISSEYELNKAKEYARSEGIKRAALYICNSPDREEARLKLHFRNSVIHLN